MTRLALAALVAAGALAALGGLGGCAGCGARANDGLETVRIGDETFHLEVASDFESRQTGLMHRESLPEDGGMLFVFPDVRHRSFWMAYCLVDIDIIYLDGQGRITAMYRMEAQPPRRPDESVAAYEWRMHEAARYPSRYPAQFVIELPAGTLDRLDLSVDDKIALDLPRLKALAQ